MIKKVNNTAVLVFIRTSKDEISNKRFLNAGARKNQNFIKILNARTIKTAKASNLPYFVINSNLQSGENFCQKFENAFQDIFEKGFSNVIAIGNDSPNLVAEDLIFQANELENNAVTFGKTNKKGLYTFGLTKEAFKNIDFTNIDWQQSTLISSLIKELELANLTFAKLNAEYFELNSEKDVYCFLTAIRNVRKLNLEFTLLLNFIINSFFFNQSWIQISNIRLLNELQFRGPPMRIA